MFDILQVRPVLLNSKLPMDVLGRVWDLSDIDKDGQLDKDEFCVVSFVFEQVLLNLTYVVCTVDHCVKVVPAAKDG